MINTNKNVLKSVVTTNDDLSYALDDNEERELLFQVFINARLVLPVLRDALLLFAGVFCGNAAFFAAMHLVV